MNNQENKNLTIGISSFTPEEIKGFQANITQMGFQKALINLMRNNTKLATEINMISSGLKEQNPNGPSPLDTLDAAVNNLPREGGVAFVVAQYRGEKTVILKGNEGLVSAVLCEAMSESSQIENFLKSTMIVSDMTQSLMKASINGLSEFMSLVADDLKGASSMPEERKPFEVLFPPTGWPRKPKRPHYPHSDDEQ